MEEPTLVWDDTENAENHQNGEKADEKGPCQCGYRHWVDGVIYDFVFGLQGEAIGFNLGDNALAAAEEFVQKKNNLGLGFKTQEHVNNIANQIRQALVKEGYEESDTREEWDASTPMKTIRLGETGRILPNGTKLTFELSDILTADQKAASQKREEDSRKFEEHKKLELENSKKIKEDINRAREADHLEREKNREWQDSLRAMNESPSLHSSTGDKIKKWMINGVLTDVTLEQYVKLKENSEKDSISPKDNPSKNNNNEEEDYNAETHSNLLQQLKLMDDLEKLKKEENGGDPMELMRIVTKLLELQGGRTGTKRPKIEKNNNNKNKNNYNNNKNSNNNNKNNNKNNNNNISLKRYLPTSNSSNIIVENVAAMLNLKGREACRKWLEEIGGDEDKIKEVFELGEKYLKTHGLTIIDPNDPWKGTANSLSESSSNNNNNNNKSNNNSNNNNNNSFKFNFNTEQKYDFSNIGSTKRKSNDNYKNNSKFIKKSNSNNVTSTQKHVALRWTPVDNFKIVLKDGDKTKLKITLPNKTQVVLTVNLSTTLRELHDHIRTESKVGMLADFDLVKQDSPTNIIDDFDKTLLELNLKNQLLMCIERNS
jgi:hypothetical protein